MFTDLQCADLRLISESAFAAGNWDQACLNRVSSTQTKRPSAVNPELARLLEVQEAEAAAANATASEALTHSHSGLNNVESGVVGAMVSLGSVLTLLAIAYFAGVVGFGKKAKKARQSTFVDNSVSADVVLGGFRSH